MGKWCINEDSMQNNFWQDIVKRAYDMDRPLFILAPMADVTDCVFRELIAKYSKFGTKESLLDVFWTEFVSADGLCSPVREVLKRDLVYSDKEHPIVAQLFGSNVENMRNASKLCAELGFDGIDINMGCPDKSIEKQGAGAAMMKNPENARAIIRAAYDGARDAKKEIPISVKTRIGYNKIEYKTWLEEILKEPITTLIIHFRTRKEMSLVPAHWELAREIIDYVHSLRPDLIIIGNGDVLDITDGIKKYKETGIDGVMIGRGIFGKPWLFNAIGFEPTLKQKFEILIEHTHNFEKTLGDSLIRIINSDGRITEKVVPCKSFAIMKKHYKAYINGFVGAKELREKMMQCNNATEVEKILREFIKENFVL